MARRIIAIVAILIALAAGVYIYIQTNPAPAEARRAERAATAQAIFQRAQSEFATLATTPVADLASPDAVRTLLTSAHQFSPLPADAGPQDQLLTHLADFIYHRFVQPDPAAYRQWRADNGYTLIEWPELVEFWQLDKDYEARVGQPAPPDLTSAAAFDALWRAEADAASKFLGPVVALPADQRGIIIGGCTYSTIANNRPRLAGDPAHAGFDADLWDGRGIVGCSRWYSSRHREPHLSQTWIVSATPVPFADVALIVRFRDGTLMPVRIGCVWDPVRRAWSIESLGAGNIPAKGLGVVVF